MSEQQPALATTKRKFTKLLDNLTGSSSTTSLANALNESNTSVTSPATSTNPEPPSKRSRLSGAGMEQPRSAAGNDRIKALQEKLFTPRKDADKHNASTVRVVGPNKTTERPTTPRKAPNYQPYSQDQFLERLKTFADVKKWTSKPDAVGDVAWAKRGWKCEAWNTVACKAGCEKRVVVKLRPKRKDGAGKEIEMSEDVTVEIDDGLVKRFEELIVDGHDEECLWRKRGCDDKIYHIPVPNRAQSTAELLDRYRSFQSIANDLPLLEDLIYPGPQIGDILKRTPPTTYNPPGSTTIEESPTSATDIVAFTLALFGWSGVSESKISLATCNHCFQRIGLWLCAHARLEEVSTRLQIPIESLGLNLLESHREHCPWKNPVTQGNPKGGPIEYMAAWQTLEFMLLGSKKKREEHKKSASVDLISYRESFESDRRSVEKDEGDNLNDKWKRFKARLRRTTSRRSLRSVKSTKSVRSVKSNGEKENEGSVV